MPKLVIDTDLFDEDGKVKLENLQELNFPEFTENIIDGVKNYTFGLMDIYSRLDALEGGLTTPAVPTNGVVDDENNTFTFTPTPDYSVYEYQINNGAITESDGTTISVGNLEIPVGMFKVRVKAQSGANNASAWLTNDTPFTAVGPQLLFTDNFNPAGGGFIPFSGYNNWIQFAGDMDEEVSGNANENFVLIDNPGFEGWVNNSSAITNVENGRIELSIQSGKDIRTIVFFRYQDPNNHYWLSFEQYSNEMYTVLRKRVDGVLSSEIGVSFYAIPQNTRYTAFIDFTGNTFKITINEVENTYNDNTIVSGGKIGIGSDNISSTGTRFIHAPLKVYSL